MSNEPTRDPSYPDFDKPAGYEAPQKTEIEPSLLASELAQEFETLAEAPNRDPFFDRELIFIVGVAFAVLIPVVMIILSLPSHRQIFVIIAIPVVVLVFCALLFAVATRLARWNARAASYMLKELKDLTQFR